MIKTKRVVHGEQKIPFYSGYVGSFNGTSDYTNISDDSSLRLVNKITIMAWIYPKYYGDALRDIVVKSPTSAWPTANYRLGVTANGTILFVHGDGSSYEANESSSNVQLMLWQCITVTNNGIYINGEIDKSFTLIGEWYTDTSPLRIGVNPTNNSINVFNGLIAIVIIWNDYILSNSQIKKAYNNPYDPPKKDKIVLWLTGNTIDTSAGTWYDLSQYKNNGTIYGMTKTSIAREQEVVVG